MDDQLSLPVPSYEEPLPDCDGPKLRPFPGRHGAITFIRLISEGTCEGDAHVFEVDIDSKTYALKVFKFFDDADLAGLSDIEFDEVGLSTIYAHLDPFYNECRAFGRLEQSNVNGKVAVHCYGHMTFSADDEKEIDRHFDTQGTWQRLIAEDRLRPAEKQPLRAIVKDLIREDKPLTHMMVKKMLRDLKKIRKLRVYPSDIRAPNYKAGILLDLSTAYTEPHFMFKTRAPHEVEYRKCRDLVRFDRMIDEAGVKTWVRALPNREYTKKLRSATQTDKDKVVKRQQ